MSRKPLIQIIGSLNVDYTTNTPRCPGPGETITANSLDINAGGKGANQAVGCGRAAFTAKNHQDVDVHMVGAVGKNDPQYASLLKPSLEYSGVSTEKVREVDGQQTGTATIIVDEGAGGENRILVVTGANHGGMNDAQEVINRSTSGTIPDVIVMQGEIPRSTTLSLLQHYNDNSKTKVVFNPAPVWPEGVPGKTLDGLAVLVVNETECVMLTQSMIKEGYSLENVREEDLTEDGLSKLASQYHKLVNVQTLVVTLGSKGVFYSQHTGQSGIVPAVKVEKVVDTTAAGDTFVGYFAVDLARRVGGGDTEGAFDVESACKKAAAASAKCVARKGASQSIPFGYE